MVSMKRMGLGPVGSCCGAQDGPTESEILNSYLVPPMSQTDLQQADRKKRCRTDQCNFQLSIWDSWLPVLLPHQDEDLVDVFPRRELFCGTFQSLVCERSAPLVGTSHCPFFVWIEQSTAKPKLVSSVGDRECILFPRIKTLTLGGDYEHIEESLCVNSFSLSLPLIHLHLSPSTPPPLLSAFDKI